MYIKCLDLPYYFATEENLAVYKIIYMLLLIFKNLSI